MYFCIKIFNIYLQKYVAVRLVCVCVCVCVFNGMKNTTKAFLNLIYMVFFASLI